jgi:hypothetical protein
MKVPGGVSQVVVWYQGPGTGIDTRLDGSVPDG